MTMTTKELEEWLRKMNSDIHHLTTDLSTHKASKEGCANTVKALERDVWGNGKPGFLAIVGSIQTKLAIVEAYVKAIQVDQAEQHDQRKQERQEQRRFLYALMTGCILSALSGIGSLVVQLLRDHVVIQDIETAISRFF